jgi:hypothetical protein
MVRSRAPELTRDNSRHPRTSALFRTLSLANRTFPRHPALTAVARPDYSPAPAAKFSIESICLLQ